MTGPPVVGQEQADRELWSEPARQAPLAVVFLLLKAIRSIGLAQLGVVVALLISGRVPWTLLGVAPVVGAVVLGIITLSWWRHVFSIRGDELLVAKGILSQERLSIPLDRIQSVSIERRFLHRFVNLVAVSVDTAGSDKAEFEVDALERHRAEALQRIAAAHQRTRAVGAAESSTDIDGPILTKPSPPAEVVMIERSFAQLARISLARWPWTGFVVLAPVIALGGEFIDRLVQVDFGSNFFLARWINRATEASDGLEFSPYLLALVLAGLVAGVLVATLLGAGLQLIRTLIGDWGLKLVRTPSGLRRTAGLFSVTSRASTTIRVQGIRTEQNPIQKRLGFSQLVLPTIGDGDLVVPGASPEETAQLRAVVMPTAEAPSVSRMIERSWIAYQLRIQAMFVVPLAGLGAWWWQPWALLALFALPLNYLVLRRRWRLRRWGMSPDSIAERLQFVDVVTAEIELIKAQTVTVSQNLFQRRRGLATVSINAAEGHLEVPMIPLADAQQVRDRTLARVESDRRRWM